MKYYGYRSCIKNRKKSGAVGLFTKWRVDRKEYVKQALIMVLIGVENNY
ncbi:DUF84 family protein [archaeon]|nr:DUF84 family protein [archaeon]MBT6761659.1 DUF84 family protein [archaeon]